MSSAFFTGNLLSNHLIIAKDGRPVKLFRESVGQAAGQAFSRERRIRAGTERKELSVFAAVCYTVKRERGCAAVKICVYGASGDRLDARYFEAARAFGALLGARGHCLIFGGGAGGLMGACAEGAAAGGAEIVGIAPRFFDEPGVLYRGCTRFIFTDTMRERKALMEEEADAFVALPGGIGTLEELFETMTLKQLGQHGKPMALLNTLGYYDALQTLLERAAEGGFMSTRCLKLYTLCDTPESALYAVEHAAPLRGGIGRLADYTK